MSVPDGFVLVPKEPTPEILMAMARKSFRGPEAELVAEFAGKDGTATKLILTEMYQAALSAVVLP